MRVKDLNGKETHWNITGHVVNVDSRARSSLHLRARQLLKSRYPTATITEEVPIKIRPSETLYLDFFLPLQKLCIEVHGEQHYKFSSHYHGTVAAFAASKKRDAAKKEWCEINNIRYVELSYKDNDEIWREQI